MSESRGMVILYEDLCDHWIRWAKEAQITNLGVHKIAISGDGTVNSIESLLAALEKPDGRKMIKTLEKAGITIEYELHSLSWLLPRELIEKNEELFRLNKDGIRTNDMSFCPSNNLAYEIISERAYEFAKTLKQTSHNYFLWPDDMTNGECNCEKCKANGYSGADTGMLFANAVAEGLKAYDSKAMESYIAYADAKSIPKLKPSENVFLEFAPMDRDHNKPMNAQDDNRGEEYIKLLEGLLEIFPAETTHILEYWFDNALYSDFKKPPVKIPFNDYVMDEDMKLYTSYGINKIKSFGSYIDEEYFNLHGNPPVGKYGEILAKYIKI